MRWGAKSRVTVFFASCQWEQKINRQPHLGKRQMNVYHPLSVSVIFFHVNNFLYALAPEQKWCAVLHLSRKEVGDT